MLLTDKSTAADIKEIIRNLQTGTEKLNEDLEALQHNFLLRGYFKKKAKAEQKPQ
jgi:phospholipid/cholesterol/gamma-HCH transport system substrate-binding protein